MWVHTKLLGILCLILSLPHFLLENRDKYAGPKCSRKVLHAGSWEWRPVQHWRLLLMIFMRCFKVVDLQVLSSARICVPCPRCIRMNVSEWSSGTELWGLVPPPRNVFFSWLSSLTCPELKFFLSVKGRWLYLRCIFHAAEMLKCESTLNTKNRLLLFVSRQLCDFSIYKQGTHTQFLEKYLNFSLEKNPPLPPRHAFISVTGSSSFICNWNPSLPSLKSFPHFSSCREQSRPLCLWSSQQSYESCWVPFLSLASVNSLVPRANAIRTKLPVITEPRRNGTWFL